MSAFWSGFITIGALLNIAACVWLIRWTARSRPNEVATGQPTGHTWDEGSLVELNNPMPRWWLIMFYLSIVFALIYLALFPGLGLWKGLLGWTQEGQYESEVQAADARFGPIFAAYAARDIPDLATDKQAIQIGQRLFSTYCSQCHGSSAKGSVGFPNLTDDDWLWGGEPESITATITHGRSGMMPALAPVLGEDLDAVVSYVMSLSGMVSSPTEGDVGQEKFTQVCAACHGAGGEGNPMLGAPRLSDETWLYGGSRERITETITHGRNGQMPAFGEMLGADKVHLLAAYVYSLSHSAEASAQ